MGSESPGPVCDFKDKQGLRVEKHHAVRQLVVRLPYQLRRYPHLRRLPHRVLQDGKLINVYRS